jgi:hypothetical protein
MEFLNPPRERFQTSASQTSASQTSASQFGHAAATEIDSRASQNFSTRPSVPATVGIFVGTPRLALGPLQAVESLLCDQVRVDVDPPPRSQPIETWRRSGLAAPGPGARHRQGARPSEIAEQPLELLVPCPRLDPETPADRGSSTASFPSSCPSLRGSSPCAATS